ncbi:hypothetical protein Maes01_00920 [Microbulbifer aestuariivivens]|uniref:DUF3300 domain-containing protein n=1 Tax=Microbulbifer aestuariivivens TaxID=1908308 RepID=A0ABP9WPY8_9GAMM
MKTLLNILAAASLLLAGPALAGGDHRHSLSADADSPGASAFGRAHHKEKHHQQHSPRGHGDKGQQQKHPQEHHYQSHKKKHKQHHKQSHKGSYQKHHALSQHKRRKHYRQHRHHWRPAHYDYGYRWRHLPRSFVRINIGALGFFYSDGIFYRPHHSGYVVARAPIGAVVTSLPASAVSLAFGGRNYFVAYDTFYLWDHHQRGYRIVENPGILY